MTMNNCDANSRRETIDEKGAWDKRVVLAQNYHLISAHLWNKNHDRDGCCPRVLYGNQEERRKLLFTSGWRRWVESLINFLKGTDKHQQQMFISCLNKWSVVASSNHHSFCSWHQVMFGQSVLNSFQSTWYDSEPILVFSVYHFWNHWGYSFYIWTGWLRYSVLSHEVMRKLYDWLHLGDNSPVCGWY